jgi:hypothetical protein
MCRPLDEGEVAMSDDSLSDEGLELRIRAALQDPVPDDVIRVSEGLFAWRTVDAELAELELAGADEPVGVRGSDLHTFTFVIQDQVIEVEFDADTRQLVVDLGGSLASAIRLVTPSGALVEGAINDAGISRFVDPPTGPVQLIITRQNGETIKTRWVTL